MVVAGRIEKQMKDDFYSVATRRGLLSDKWVCVLSTHSHRFSFSRDFQLMTAVDRMCRTHYLECSAQSGQGVREVLETAITTKGEGIVLPNGCTKKIPCLIF